MQEESDDELARLLGYGPDAFADADNGSSDDELEGEGEEEDDEGEEEAARQPTPPPKRRKRKQQPASKPGPSAGVRAPAPKGPGRVGGKAQNPNSLQAPPQRARQAVAPARYRQRG